MHATCSTTDLPMAAAPAWRRPARTLWQVAIVIAAWWAADQAAASLHLPFSGGVVGLFLLVLLLATGVVKPAAVELGANWLLANMLLFFIPLVVSVVQFTDLIRAKGLILLFDIGLGFACVMLATAFTVEWVCRYERQLRLKKLLRQRAARRPA
ncbi:CidA/LrgA family protein [Janthinobacterium psychrotolerans]|uniref:Holin-like protein n=1 Tax=Janthinobacterium psychrotolerans TaxID=1747903 RepID=A0A1A7BYY0_9BURK|nr:CidA/LrgA family protein [Janthinobacterium psychrotolerans]OBV38722.1 holin-like protein [Janthinobacterium psychrotolerans]